MFGQAPIEHSVGQADSAPTVGGEQAHRVVGEHAVGAAAVGDDLGVGGKFGEACGELVDRDRDRSGDVSGGVLGAGRTSSTVTSPARARRRSSSRSICSVSSSPR